MHVAATRPVDHEPADRPEGNPQVSISYPAPSVDASLPVMIDVPSGLNAKQVSLALQYRWNFATGPIGMPVERSQTPTKLPTGHRKAMPCRVEHQGAGVGRRQ
jgi:hypothetical protein